ncbi:T7SS effector LXG polymorphic toxin [Metabacillus fastidiosus]|uniref:T7SS effector LXG polymorphic toxin n=1 Tax=Metabacillus fastidiosus TaxID=1458 RepID=UPI002E1ACA30|nr:T7SS effector LXG polymorphic toxin [Metabacillus fastidiosus]
MNNKIYDAKALLATMSKRKSQYEETKKQMEALKKEFNEIVKMSEFQGKGAEAIKGFYQAQVDVADAWDSFFDMQITFLSEISGTMEDVDLHGETVVTVPFLEQNVANGITSSEKMVNAQHDDLKKIFERIQDIIVLEAFSKETFENHIGEAEKEMKETVNQVDLLDKNLQTEYAITEQHQTNVVALFSALLEATAQGGEVSPINFDSKAYEKSEIYQLQDELKQQSLDYINYKEEQAEDRRVAKEIEEKENRPWYKKVLDTGSTIVAEVTGYNDMRRAAEGVDPVTKEKLSEAERIAAGGMAIAGYIPVVGWVGRGVKAGHALYKTAKGVNAATHALQAYKTPKAFSILEKSEMGLYGLVAANGFGEYFTGKDMFGNELTEEQKQQGLMTGLMIGGTAGAARIIDKGVPNLPYSKEYVQQQIQKGQAILKDMGRATNRTLTNLRETAVSNIQQAVSRIEGAVKKIGDIKIPIGMPREQLVFADGMMDDADVTRLKDFFQRADSGGSGSRVDGRTGNGIPEVSEVKVFVENGQQFTNGRKNKLKPNIKYKTGEYDYFYETDDLGRISKFETENLQLTKREDRLPHSRNTPGKVKGQDHAGHLVGDRFGGSPKIDNLVSQLSDVNLKQYKKIEDEWAAALKETPPKKVTVDVEIIYSSNNMRPEKFKVRYTIDGISESVDIKN